MQFQEDIAVCKVGKIVSNANEATETAAATITVYMTEDAHEQMLLPQESESEEGTDPETADSVGCMKDENSYYAGLPVASVKKTSNIYCKYWCTNGGNHRGKYFRYSRVDQMCYCLNEVVSQNRDPYYTSGETICGSGTNFPTTPEIMNEGQNCFEECERKKGPCGWCGTQGLCCKEGHPQNGCESDMGGTDDSKCVAAASADIGKIEYQPLGF